MNESVRIPGTNVAVVTKAPLAAGGSLQSFIPQTLDEVWRFADIVSASGFAPPGLKTPQAVMVAIMHGAEVGMTPFASIKNIAVINSRPVIWGDAVAGLVRASGKCEYIKETIAGGENDWTATCAVKRKGEPEEVRTFSVADAKRAGVWGKGGPWTQYPKRMLGIRARSFALRDVFPDVLGGLDIREEVEDSAEMIDVTPPPAPPAEGGEQASAPIARKPRAKRGAAAEPVEEERQEEVANPPAAPSEDEATQVQTDIEDAEFRETNDQPAEEDPDALFEEFTQHLAAGATLADIGQSWDEFESRIKGQGPAFTARCSDAYIRRKEALQGETSAERKARLMPAYKAGILAFYRGRKPSLGVEKEFKEPADVAETWIKGFRNAESGKEPNPEAEAPPPADEGFPGDAPPAATADEALAAAYELGRQAKLKGMQARALPGEFRAEGREDEALAWRQGYDAAAKA